MNNYSFLFFSSPRNRIFLTTFEPRDKIVSKIDTVLFLNFSCSKNMNERNLYFYVEVSLYQLIQRNAFNENFNYHIKYNWTLSEKKRENCFSSRVIFAPERLSTGCDEKWETKVLLTRSERRLEDSGREAQVERSKGGALLLPSSISAQLP